MESGKIDIEQLISNPPIPEINPKDEELILLNILDLDKYFSELENPIIINKIPYTSNYMKDIIKAIADNKKTHSLVASCDCGNLVGNYYEGVRCNLCNTVVKNNIESSAINDIWIEIPKEIKAVPNPEIFTILRNWFNIGKSSSSYIDCILNVDEPLNEEFAGYIDGQGFNYFYDNFDYILNFFCNIFNKTASGKKDNNQIKMFIDANRDKLWCTKLPLLPSILQPITNEGYSLKYVNKNIKMILNSIIDLIDIRIMKRTIPLSVKNIEKIMYDVYSKYIDYIQYTKKYKLSKKPCILRQHVFGTRLHMTFRSVIVPIVEYHEGDELHIPWKIGLNVLKYHILSILCNRRNYSMKNAYAKIIKAFNKYDFEIDKVIQLIIRECPYKGMPVLFNRNPSLNLSAIQLLFVTKVKPSLNIKEYNKATEDMLNTYIHDETIVMSTLIVKGPNADFDGDEMNGIMLYEMDEVPKFMPLHPANRMISPIKMEMDDNITLSAQLFVMLNGWVNDD